MRSLRRDDGASAVEMAIVAPVLVLLLFGIIDFGFVLNDYISIRHGAREGARLAVVNNVGTTTSCPGPASAIVCTTRERVGVALDPSLMVVAVDFEGATTGVVGRDVSVCVGYPMDSVTGFFRPLLDGSQLNAKVTMRLEANASYAEVNPSSC